ncbi:uncharacterized protein LOC129957496 [Argiope bruennichi]|uniref:uncharacterized protein LOC129957496 n=1 Tax=Argiope bruennichi TaxID=94029 RepID=UPI0024941D73|nr:uncharacterized protein LOC129957496 [Argiope bruennichi]
MTMANPIADHLKRLYRLSLLDISQRRVAVLLCSDPLKYVHLATVENELGETIIEARDIVFKGLVDNLGIPQTMREPLVKIMTPIFLQTFKWLEFHEEYLKTSSSRFKYREYLKHFRWTHMGTINYRKTAESVIRDEKLPIDLRFMFACLYCLEEDIQDLWQKLSTRRQDEFLNKDPSKYKHQREIVVLWTCILKGRVDKLDQLLKKVGRRYYTTIYQYAFEWFAVKAYETATRYFFEKLTRAEKRASLVRTATAVAKRDGNFVQAYNDVSCFLLSHMNAEQLKKVLAAVPYGILRIFMEWPRQDAFVEVATLLLPYLQEENYKMMNFVLSRKFKLVYNSLKLFKDIFLVSPRNFRHSTYYLPEFFNNKDTDTIQFMFRNMDPGETLELFLNPITLYGIFELVNEEEWHFLEFFIRESRLSRAGVKRFAMEFDTNFESLLDRETRERFGRMVDDICTVISNQNFSNGNEVNRMNPMGFQPSAQPEKARGQAEEARPAKKNKNT